MTKNMISKEAIQVIAASILFILIAASTQNSNIDRKSEVQKRQVAHAKKH